MEEFLTKRNLGSKRFVTKKMFKCIRPGSENPADENWMTATYLSGKIENGLKLGIHSSISLLWKIKPFIESLFLTTLSHRNGMHSDYAFWVNITIKNGEEYVQAVEFYYRSDDSPVELEMQALKTKRNCISCLDKPFEIIVKTSFFCFPIPHRRLYPESYRSEESVPPKPLEKSFKTDQCVICLDKKN